MTQYKLEDSHDGFAFYWDIVLKPDRHPPTPKVACPSCLGRGRAMLSNLDYDNDSSCRCNGTGRIEDPNFKWKPSPPDELVKRLQKVYMEYWNEQQNKEFKLT